MAQVLVTGANGFLGSWLVRRLLKDGHKVRCLVRKTSDLSELEGLNPEYVYGDVTDSKSLSSAFQGMEAVFHLAGLIAYKKSERAAMERINVGGTHNVVKACLENKIPRLVYVSSVVAVGAGYTPDQVLNEESPYNVADLNLGYFETKHEAELLVQAACKNQGLNAVILNPSTIYGPGDARKGSRKNQLKAAQGKLKFYTSGGVNVVPVENCVDGIIRAWEKGRSGERYILAADNLRIKDMLTIIAEEAGQQPPSIGLPNWVLHVAGFFGDQYGRLTGKTPISRENAWTTTMYHWFDSTKAQKELGFSPGSSRDALKQSVGWMRDKGLLNK